MPSPVQIRPVAEALTMRNVKPGVFEASILSDYCFGDCTDSIAR